MLDYEEHVVKTGGDDSLQLKLIKEHNPTKAGLWAIVPGGGQIYNKKWWKLPIVYSLLGASGYLVYYFADKTVMYRNEYFFRQYGATEYYNPDLALAQDESILQSRDNNRRYMEISIGAFTICYLLSVIDAVVDAHLFYFDISDDLTMQLTPTIYNNGLLFNNNNAFRSFSSGLTLKLSF
ncbi:DUF5683 domain-containing protein [Bacteroidales bacterium OttesenSCG-928-A14]|nr:DUF5683 domain-containing protein [Bacteroidales bacterium OttesenSCG-928-A14]